jgi:mono/diheme cytochrome c family protein
MAIEAPRGVVLIVMLWVASVGWGGPVQTIDPLPESAASPADNPTTAEKAALGKVLFFDRRLSGDNTRSCASCHLPEKAFTDGLPRALGAGGKQLTRNTPTLVNVGFYADYFWDGRTRSLEQQALVPIQSAEEMNQNLDLLETELNSIPGYARLFRAAFGMPATKDAVAKALAAFERTLVSRTSAFDRYLAGDKNAISGEAQRGWDLFKGDAGCIRCHSGSTFSDGRFYRLGTAFTDKGRGAITGDKRTFYAFRTPGLRDVARAKALRLRRKAAYQLILQSRLDEAERQLHRAKESFPASGNLIELSRLNYTVSQLHWHRKEFTLAKKAAGASLEAAEKAHCSRVERSQGKRLPADVARWRRDSLCVDRSRSHVKSTDSIWEIPGW